MYILFLFYERERRTIKSIQELGYVMCLASEKEDKRVSSKREKDDEREEEKYIAMMLSIDNARPINY